MRKIASRILGKSLTFTILSIFLLYTNVSICKAKPTKAKPTKAKPTKAKPTKAKPTYSMMKKNSHLPLNDLP